MNRPDSTPLERWVLFLATFSPLRATALLEGLSASQQTAARALLGRVQGWDSQTRRGRLTLVFGERPDAPEWLTAQARDASPLFRDALAERLPPHLARAVERYGARPNFPRSPLVAAVAERLAREATRR